MGLSVCDAVQVLLHLRGSGGERSLFPDRLRQGIARGPLRGVRVMHYVLPRCAHTPEAAGTFVFVFLVVLNRVPAVGGVHLLQVPAHVRGVLNPQLRLNVVVLLSRTVPAGPGSGRVLLQLLEPLHKLLFSSLASAVLVLLLHLFKRLLQLKAPGLDVLQGRLRSHRRGRQELLELVLEVHAVRYLSGQLLLVDGRVLELLSVLLHLALGAPCDVGVGVLPVLCLRHALCGRAHVCCSGLAFGRRRALRHGVRLVLLEEAGLEGYSKNFVRAARLIFARQQKTIGLLAQGRGLKVHVPVAHSVI